MKDYEISKRIAAQVDDAAREAIAHYVLKNNGSRDELERSVEELWNLHLKPQVHG
jgi:dephospho-CoA kinase